MKPAFVQEVDQLPRCEQLERVIALLNEALNMIDDLAVRPDIGARLQHVVEILRDECFE